MSSNPQNSEHAPEVVYRRAAAPDSGSSQSSGMELAPAVTPLIIGFTLLLLVISVLGYLSVQRIDEVGRQVLDLEHGHAARANLLLQLRLALTRLDNEARARQDAEAGRGLKPPFDFPLRTAREEMKKLMPQIQRPPLALDAKWNQFRADLETYVSITEDSRRYSLDGFAKFHVVDAELNNLFSDSSREQTLIFEKSLEIQQQATKAVRLWSVIALVVGFLVATGTIWEVQRRFRQMRQSMDEVRRERSFSNQMLEGMVSAVVAIDQNDRIRSANRAFFDIFPDASIGAFIREKFAPDEAMKMLESAIAFKVTEAGYRGRWIVPADGRGSEKSFDVYSSPLAIDGDQGQIITLVDVTEAAEAERVMRRNESLAAMGQATAQVAHEIKNPLGSIRLGVSMLRDAVRADKEALRTIDLVERGVNHLNKLVVDVTEYSRQKPLSRTNVELGDLLNRSLELVAERIKEKATPVEKRFSSEHLRGLWDADQLTQVFVNVIANAVDASPTAHAITVSTEVVHPSENGAASVANARVTISDDGGGMDPATLDRIFEPFFSTKKRGTGLGLAIVKQIVEQHGGKIVVTSEEGKGSSFTIDLPM
ncbi:MAG TPA: ATP-binding protein [Pyrinomonadaceae bacterium]|nr:ATP-binding protein [Pyrinomonadaceae bacterium]